MSVLVAYATHSGATRTLAETLAATLEERGVAVELADLQEGPDPAGHDAVVLGSAVRAESFEKTAVNWAKTHLDVLVSRPLAVFSCSGSASDPAKGGKQKAPDAFRGSLPLRPVAGTHFPGWVLMERIPVHERMLLKSLRTPTGDFRDLSAVAAWAREIAPQLTR